MGRPRSRGERLLLRQRCFRTSAGAVARFGGCALLAACSPSSLASSPGAFDDTVSLACPELGGTADPLEVSYSSDPASDGRLRAFVATARGMYDLALEAERLAVNACHRIAGDMGWALPSDAADLGACRPLEELLTSLPRRGVELRISVVEPRCEEDSRRSERCLVLCGTGGSACDDLCSSQAAIYAECTLPAVRVAASSDTDDLVHLARALESHLPSLLYAELALGRRLSARVENLARLSSRLPADLGHAGPRGLACAAIAAGIAGKSAQRLILLLNATSRSTRELALSPTAPLEPVVR